MTTAQPAIPPEAKAPSIVPVLGEGFQSTSQTTAQEPASAGANASESAGDKDPKKRHFWQLGKKKEDKKRAAAVAAAAAAASASSSAGPSASNPSAKLRSSSPLARSPSPSSPRIVPSSPGGLIQGSPRVASPASSQIFERNVQEDVVAASPAIPSHIATENHIPPVLDASSHAITDDHLNPDSVEIVTHTAHQPAAELVATATDHSNAASLPPISTTVSDENNNSQAHLGTSPSTTGHGIIPIPVQHALTGTDTGLSDDSASNYGNLDSADVRRLSFISFADVVHAEQAASSGDHTSMRDSLIVSPVPTSAVASPIPHAARSPSPIRSPVSPPLSSGSASPPLGIEGSPPPISRIAGSPRAVGKGLGLSASPSVPTVQGELAVETMAQALRKTGSGDLNAPPLPLESERLA